MKARFICFNAQWDIGTKMVKEWKKWQTFYKYAYNKNLQNVKKKKRKDIDNIALSFTSNKVLSFIHDRK